MPSRVPIKKYEGRGPLLFGLNPGLTSPGLNQRALTLNPVYRAVSPLQSAPLQGFPSGYYLHLCSLRHAWHLSRVLPQQPVGQLLQQLKAMEARDVAEHDELLAEDGGRQRWAQLATAQPAGGAQVTREHLWGGAMGKDSRRELCVVM